MAVPSCSKSCSICKACSLLLGGARTKWMYEISEYQRGNPFRVSHSPGCMEKAGVMWSDSNVFGSPQNRHQTSLQSSKFNCQWRFLAFSIVFSVKLLQCRWRVWKFWERAVQWMLFWNCLLFLIPIANQITLIRSPDASKGLVLAKISIPD